MNAKFSTQSAVQRYPWVPLRDIPFCEQGYTSLAFISLGYRILYFLRVGVKLAFKPWGCTLRKKPSKQLGILFEQFILSVSCFKLHTWEHFWHYLSYYSKEMLLSLFSFGKDDWNIEVIISLVL